ncbi:fungal pheromone STE3G-protein-coupled receptor [Peniophora sp. CONT]|nr:fungal pheromone STE3G-protein-coupled receptor [Peniophora sp. CONT]
MAADDPSYPLYPLACIISAIMLLLILVTNTIRQNWNLGVIFLCVWIFFDNVTNAINAIAWSDNVDIKLYVYCDIVTRVQLVAYVVKPMATLIITRRLYLIARNRAVELPTRAARRRDLLVEWMLGFIIPLLCTDVYQDYIFQASRFDVLGSIGCKNSQLPSILDILLMQLWNIVPPLISIIFYYPSIIRMFYLQYRDVNRFIDTNDSVSRKSYIRILILASIDVLLTLPIGITTLVLDVLTGNINPGPLPFYPGWDLTHSDWAPESVTYAEIAASPPSYLARTYFSAWTSPVLAFAIFALFGLTAEARASYWRVFFSIGAQFGWKPTFRARGGARSTLGPMQFGTRTQEVSNDDDTG